MGGGRGGPPRLGGRLSRPWGAVVWALLAAGPALAADYPLPAPPPVSTAATHLDFVANHLDYDDARSEIHLKGAVRVKESTWTIKGDELWLDTKREIGRSEGDLLVEDGVTALYGDSGQFDFRNHSGTLYHVSAGHGDWRIHARSAEMDPHRKLTYYGADFTSCNVYPNPHYHFHSSRITVIPKKHLFARNTVFYLGPVPIFYTPFLYKSLDPDHFLRFKVQPGYDRRNGVFAKGTMITQHSPWLYSKLYLDYYSSQGAGTGGEVNLHKGQDARGVVYGYQIHERSTGRERWTIQGNDYQALASSMAFQSRFQAASDPTFNNDYARSSLFRVTPELVNSAAVTLRRSWGFARLSYARDDQATADQNHFMKNTEDAPRIDVQTTQLRFWRLPWLNTLTGFADNNFDQTRPFLQKSVGGGWEGTQVIPIAKGLSLTPKAGYTQTYYNRFDELNSTASTSTVRDGFIGRYSGGGTLRLQSLVGDWDLTHLYTRRQQADSMADDAGANDHGVEANLLTLEDFFRPARRVFVRAISGYDFRVFRDHTVGFRDRVQPITGEVTYVPRANLNFTVRDDYQLEQGNRSFLFNTLWGDPLGTHLGGGAGYNIGESGQYFLNTEFGWAPSSGTWRAIGSLRSMAATPGGISRLNGFQLFEKELTLVKVWHDFITRVQLRFRPGGVREVSFRVELKLGSTSKDKAPRRDWESEWFPERAAGTVDRP